MPEYFNPHNYVVHLPGPDGKTTRVKPGQRVVLSEFFDRYRARGFLRAAGSQPTVPTNQNKPQAKIASNARPKPQSQPKIIQKDVPLPQLQPRPIRDEIARARKMAMAAKITNKSGQHIRSQTKSSPQPVVGKRSNVDPNQLLKTNLAYNNYPVSNNIGIGILSFNRVHSLRRLVESIIRNTDLRRTTIFISDDGSTDPATLAYLDELVANNNFVIIKNANRGGVACNSNRLLRCLSRFAYGMLLNDDVEILNAGWDNFYFEAMRRSGLHHMMYRQHGVYGADRGVAVDKHDVQLFKIDDKPHGAVLAFSNHFLQTVGYFNETYGLYGMEHVDWSQRASEFGLQDTGFFDVAGSERYFKLYAEASSVPDRSRLLQEARSKFARRNVVYVSPTDASVVPEISYVVPFRDFERTDSIATVINNLRAQRYPQINIIMVEQDSNSKIDLAKYNPVQHFLVKADHQLFNKSKAFNFGVAHAPSDMIILHDADMLAQGHYTQSVANILKDHESCHIGSTVLYTSQESMKKINLTGIVDEHVICERTVGYYEGGSLGVTKRGFWKCGGFNEDYWGYGCEDCDFYARLSGYTNWNENRIFDFLHLWHSRVGGWNNHHETNKILESSLKQLQIQERVLRQYQQLRMLGYGQELAEALK